MDEMLNVSKTADTSQTKRITTDSLNAVFVSSGKVLTELGLIDTYGPWTKDFFLNARALYEI